jgi:mannose-6-phosphate isomerase-like protein (cupin superfamily)
MTKEAIFQHVEQLTLSKGFRIVNQDDSRPWGGFFVIDEAQAGDFIQAYFPHLSLGEVMLGNKLSPKMLIVAPGMRLSWQYHFRRAELWRVVEGPIAVAISPDDAQPEPGSYQAGDIITLRQGERHRLIGLDNWGVVAEIWQHTDPAQPSDESDIVRLQDDFGR